MPKCIVCDNEHFVNASEFHKDLVRCTGCGLVFYNKIESIVPTDIYTTTYFNGIYYDYLADKEVSQRNFANRLKVIQKFVQKGSLLEIGAAYGFFLELAKKYYSVSGIDIVEECIRYAKNDLGINNMACGDYMDIAYSQHYFDATCMFDTIEHLKHPDKYIVKINRELKLDGILCITTGDIQSLMANIQKKKWRLIDPPAHLYYFSPSTLHKLLERYGFDIIHSSHPGYYRSSALMLYLTFFKNKSALTESALFKMLQKLPVYLNLYDIMFVIGRKKRDI